ncbi:MAG: sialate O-acetylesterase [Armatimonadetes bacterium]|nr:sialate O-acetylesterase [Armatimonadota bacterium]
MRNLKIMILIALVVLCAAMPMTSFAADLRLPRIFGDNMVLQAGVSTPVWGWATPGSKVSVSIDKQTVSGVTDSEGKWKATLKNLKQSATPTTVTIKADTTITLQNVLIGDCWLGSGQSNMEMAMADITNARDEIAAANNPAIRLFTVIRNEKGMLADDCEGKWVVCTPETVNRFSSVLYLFGREISQKTNIPLGLIHSSVGGTRIELWTAPEGFDLIPDFAHYNTSIKATDEAFSKSLPDKLTALEEWTKSARKAIAENKLIPVSPEWPSRPDAEGGAARLYNGMIHPLVPFALRGFVWYQGEWNGGEDDIYVERMKALIGGWRKIWGMGDLPFYYVQLARMPEKDHSPWLGNGLTPTREAQLKSLSIPNTGMSCIIDLEGSSGWHPGNKQDPSKRLALWALKNEYGMNNLVVSGPLYKSMRFEGNKIIISFDYTGSGLMVGLKNGLEPVKQLLGTLGSFGIAGEDKKWFPATADIIGKEVIVSSPDVAAPAAVRYGYCNDPDNCNLYNIEGLPASPFRTDNW